MKPVSLLATSYEYVILKIKIKMVIDWNKLNQQHIEIVDKLLFIIRWAVDGQ